MKYLDMKILGASALYAVHEVRYELEAGTASLSQAMDTPKKGNSHP